MQVGHAEIEELEGRAFLDRQSPVHIGLGHRHLRIEQDLALQRPVVEPDRHAMKIPLAAKDVPLAGRIDHRQLAGPDQAPQEVLDQHASLTPDATRVGMGQPGPACLSESPASDLARAVHPGAGFIMLRPELANPLTMHAVLTGNERSRATQDPRNRAACRVGSAPGPAAARPAARARRATSRAAVA